MGLPRIRSAALAPGWGKGTKVVGALVLTGTLHESFPSSRQHSQSHPKPTSPQFHIIYDDLFETVHASASETPASWPNIFTLNHFNSDFDDEDFVPTLPDKWLTPVKLSQQQQREQIQCSQDGAPSADDQHAIAPDDNEMQPERVLPALPGALY